MRLREEYGRPSLRRRGRSSGEGRVVASSRRRRRRSERRGARAHHGAPWASRVRTMSTAPRSHASMSGVTPFLSCGGRTGEGAGRATRSGVVAPGGARRGWLAGEPGAGARGTRDGRGGRDGDAARGSRERPTWNPGSAPSRSAASTASASPALAARSNRRELIAADGAAGRGAKCDASIRASPFDPSRRRERPPRSARLGFDRGRSPIVASRSSRSSVVF